MAAIARLAKKTYSAIVVVKSAGQVRAPARGVRYFGVQPRLY